MAEAHAIRTSVRGPQAARMTRSHRLQTSIDAFRRGLVYRALVGLGRLATDEADEPLEKRNAR